MQTSGFASAPVSRFLLLLLISTSLLTTLSDTKYLLPVRPHPHLYPWLQLSRPLTAPLALTSSTDLLFTTLLLYHLRVLERLLGPRKYASFLLAAYALSTLLTTFLLLVVFTLTGGRYNYLPAGPTATVLAALALWREEVPRLYRYRLITSTGPAKPGQEPLGITLSDKSTTYVLAVQLALSQFPYTLLPAAVGWVVGSAWAGELLPGRVMAWRVPGWVVGEFDAGKRERSRGERERFEGLRRRLEEEGAGRDGMRTSGNEAIVDEVAGQTRRRPMLQQVGDYFRGTF